MTPISLNINFDSLGEAFGYPKGFEDPSFFSIFDRITNIVSKYDIRLSVFLIGKDLRNENVMSRVREWAQEGHEIGNHTWSHHMSLGSLPQSSVETEIKRCHDKIIETADVCPVGFIAPAWSTSKHVARTLIELDYLYDTSLFPSVYLYPVVMNIALNHIKNRDKFAKTLSRGDWTYPLTRPTTPYLSDSNYRPTRESQKSILVMPLPTLNRWSLPYWHTLGFKIGKKKSLRYLQKMLTTDQPFYYLIHPADFIGADDIDKSHQHSLARMNVPIDSKLSFFEEALELLTSTGRPVVTMKDLAKSLRKEYLLNNG